MARPRSIKEVEYEILKYILFNEQGNFKGLTDLFESLGGVNKFEMTIDDTNGAETIKVLCQQWSQTWAFDNFYSLSATFIRCYEA